MKEITIYIKAALAGILLAGAVPLMAGAVEERKGGRVKGEKVNEWVHPDTIPAGPFITFKTNTLDLGEMGGSAVKEGELTLYNSGTETLEIYNVHSDCGCTIPKLSKMTGEPGDSSVLHIRFSAKGRDWGAFRKVIRIRSNAVNIRAHAFVKGKVKRPALR